MSSEQAPRPAYMEQWHNQIERNVASVAPALALNAWWAHKDAQAAAAQQNSAMLAQQVEMNKQMFIQNHLLAGWSMEDTLVEIAAGEAMHAARQTQAKVSTTLPPHSGLLIGETVCLLVSFFVASPPFIALNLFLWVLAFSWFLLAKPATTEPLPTDPDSAP
jgi:hypothetical protein